MLTEHQQETHATPVVKEVQPTPVMKERQPTPVMKDRQPTPVMKERQPTPVMKERVETRDAIQPLTIEQLNSLYYNQQLEQNDFYIDKFVEVKLKLSCTETKLIKSVI